MAALALALGCPAAAQDPAARAPAATVCEFHVWPGDGLMSVMHGWFHGNIVNGAIQGRPGYPTIPPDPIDTATQAQILAQLQPQRLIGQADYRLIVHDAALPSRTIRTTPGRIAPSTSPCYDELIVDDVVLQQDFVNGSLLKVLFHYRHFGPDALPRRSYATWAERRLGAFPPRDPAQLNASIAELRNAYRQSLGIFAELARYGPHHRRR